MLPGTILEPTAFCTRGELGTEFPRSAAESLGASIGRIGQPVDNARAGATLAPGLLIVLRTPRMVERNCVVRPLRLKAACSRIKGCGCLVAVLLGIAGLGNSNLAAA